MPIRFPFRHRAVVAAMVAALAVAAPASADGWRDVANAFDQDRLDRHDEAYESARAQADAQGQVSDRKRLDVATSRPPQVIDADGLEGPWRCYTIKMGGLVPLVAYRWFDCRIDRDDEGLSLRKLNGSQRTNGRFYEDPENPKRMIYLGATSLGDESFIAQYSGPTGSAGASVDNRDTAGVLIQRGPDLLTIGFPFPVVESEYDFLVLKR